MKKTNKAALLNFGSFLVMLVSVSIVAYSTFSELYFLPYQVELINSWPDLFLYLAPIISFLFYSFWSMLAVMATAMLIALAVGVKPITNGYAIVFEVTED